MELWQFGRELQDIGAPAALSDIGLPSSCVRHFCTISVDSDSAVDRFTRQSIVPRSRQPVMAEPNSPKIYDGPYAAQLIETANAMVAPGKGPQPCGFESS